MTKQSPDERIRFLEHGVQWRSDLIDQWKANQANLWRIVESQEEMIKALTRQRDAARVELASMIASQQMIIGHKDFTPDQVLASRGWVINWSALSKDSDTPTKEAKDAE